MMLNGASDTNLFIIKVLYFSMLNNFMGKIWEFFIKMNYEKRCYQMNELKDFFKCFYPHDSSIEDWFTSYHKDDDELSNGLWFSCLMPCKIGSMLIERNDFILVDRSTGTIVGVLKSLDAKGKIQIIGE